MNLLREIIGNKKLLLKLAKNDFKTKYAGSYLGIFWAFVQPVVTIAIYVFVFQVGFRAGGTENGYHFVLYLIAGIIPWFFFAEALQNATSCLLEYSYLVKKVVFNISILPILKVISSLFVHLFFIVISYIIFAANGKMPGVQFVQIIYYTICAIVLVSAISYFTCSITPFFKDFAQIINIITQIGMWMTPIMWKESMLIGTAAEKFMIILKLNPMYYIVQGYRDAFMDGAWFFEHGKLTLYFWCFVIAAAFIGNKVFNRMRVHFSDVL